MDRILKQQNNLNLEDDHEGLVKNTYAKPIKLKENEFDCCRNTTEQYLNLW